MNPNSELSTITVNYGTGGAPLRPFWNATGYANADFTYTPAFGRMYDYLSSYAGHMRYMRLHNILTLHGEGDRFLLEWNLPYGNRCFENNNRQNGDDKVVLRREDGSLEYHWEWVDKVYDIIVGHGMAPIVELIYIPSAIRKDEKEFFLPESYRLYGQVIEAFTRHCVERYGLEEVRGWYFEIWNEPDNIPAWRADISSFCALYDYMEHAVHAVDKSLRTGGPATKQFEVAFEMFRRFIEHCAHGVNYCTGGYGARLDFLSVHCKGGWPDSYSPSSNVMFSSLQRYLELLKDYPMYQDTEFLNDESDIVWAGSQGVKEQSWLDFRNTHYAPGFVCKMVSRYCYELLDAGVNLSVADSDNAHLQWERSLFSGNRSQLTPLGEYPTADILKKPFFNAYVLLSRLGDERFPAECGDGGFHQKFGALPTRRGKQLAVLVWNFEDGLTEAVGRRSLRLRLEQTGLAGSCRLIEYRIDARHSNANSAWHDLGAPACPDAGQIAKLRTAADLEPAAEVKALQLEDSPLEIELELPPHAVSLLLLAPENPSAPAPVSGVRAEAEEGFAGNPQVFLKWKPSPEPDFFHYRILRRKNGGEWEVLSDRPSLNTATYVDMDAERGVRYTYRVDALNLSGAVSGAGEESGSVAL
ncbi:MAG: hypothetical protein HFG26_11250 [Provencibacterium sp.]|jgi:hypothetical protein|nr:hypothetical protein [Provencibacterium sp.]